MRSIVWVVLLVGLPSAISFGCSGDEESNVEGDGGSGSGGKAGTTAGGRAGIGGLGGSGSAGRNGGSGGNASSTGGTTGNGGSASSTGGTTGNGGSASSTGGTTVNGGSAGAAGHSSDVTGGANATGGSAGRAGSTPGNGVVAGSAGSTVGSGGIAGSAGSTGGVAGSIGTSGGNGMAGNGGSAGAAGSDGNAGNGGVAGAAGGYGTAGTGGIDVASCQTIKQAAPASADGVYSIDPDGAGGNAPFSAYCDMTRDGGGWTLVSKLNSASAHSVSEPRGFIGLELNLDQMLDTTMRSNTPPAAHGFARILPLVTDEVTVAKFELVNGSNPTQTLPFYKLVIGANLATWFAESESTATLTCIDAGLAEQCTTSAFYRLSGGTESAQILAGMTMSKHGLSAAGEIHLRVDGDYVDFFSGVWSGNSAWRNYDSYWGNGLLVWFRDRAAVGG